MLFGFHRMDSFPLDVWMNRVMDTHYPNGFPWTPTIRTVSPSTAMHRLTA